ncbi:glycosyltransferase family 2 protein [Ornithinimicrobium sp. LYQ103]|uniref:glycosyltransferase family 2 protein n=1 Tax=Ornithinimicrobium sp. LYQ103 TaxID=3378796 RepID=UPI0038528279
MSERPSVGAQAPGAVLAGVVAVVPAKDEEERIGATIVALQSIPYVLHVVVVDDGSRDQTAAVAEWTGHVDVVRHSRNRGKSAAMTTGSARAAELAPGAPVLFADADLEGSAAALGVLVGPVLADEAEMTIAVLPPQDRPGGGFGVVVRTARAGITRLTGWTPAQPLSGQRCLSRAALDAAMPLADGWGVEVGLTVDVLRNGDRVLEVPCELRHRVTGRDLASQAHRARQLADVTRALAERSGAAGRARARAVGAGRRAGAGVGRAGRAAAALAARARTGSRWHHL